MKNNNFVNCRLPTFAFEIFPQVYSSLTRFTDQVKCRTIVSLIQPFRYYEIIYFHESPSLSKYLFLLVPLYTTVYSELFVIDGLHVVTKFCKLRKI